MSNKIEWGNSVPNQIADWNCWGRANQKMKFAFETEGPIWHLNKDPFQFVRHRNKKYTHLNNSEKNYKIRIWDLWTIFGRIMYRFSFFLFLGRFGPNPDLFRTSQYIVSNRSPPPETRPGENGKVSYNERRTAGENG